MTSEASLNDRLKYTCPRCQGRWKALEDARACHGMEPCTKEADCAASSHFGDCKSMPATDDAIAASQKVLMKELLTAIDSLSIDDEYSPEFRNGFHRGVLASHAAVKKFLSEGEQRAYWRRKQSESRQRRRASGRAEREGENNA